MGKPGNTIGDASQTLGSWVGDLRKELENIRESSDGLDKIDILRLRVETAEIEAKLIETWASIVRASMEGMVKIASS